MNTNTTSGAADLPEALRRSTAADGKTELFNLPGYPLMVRAVDFNRIHTESEMRRTALLDEMQKAALAAGQATAAQQSGAKLNYSVLYVYANQHGIDYNSLCVAVREASAQPAAQQGVAYAALPTSSHAGSFLIGTCPLYTADKMRAFADATHALRASHGQAPAHQAVPVVAYRFPKAGINNGYNYVDSLEGEEPRFYEHWEALCLATPPTAQADPDGEAFRTAARLGLTLRFYGGCAQSSMPGTPSAYEVVTGSDRAAAMREAVERAGAVIASGGESKRLGDAAQAAEPVAWAFKYDDGTWHDPSTTEHSSGMRPLVAAPQPVARVPMDEARRLFDAGWKAAALFCDREDVVADGIIGFGACPQFEAAFSAAHGLKGGQHGTE